MILFQSLETMIAEAAGSRRLFDGWCLGVAEVGAVLVVGACGVV